MSRIKRLMKASGRLQRCTSGLALVEFAMVLPVFLTMSLTGAELTNYIITRLRVSQAALHLADNAARIGTGTMLQAKRISETDINDLLTGAGYQAGELDLYANGRVIISSLQPVTSPNLTNRYNIVWQRCRGTKTTYTPQYGRVGLPTGTAISGMGPTGRQVTAPDNGATMYVEVYYDYQPLVKNSLAPSIRINEIASMMVRDRRDLSVGVGHLQGIYNTENATVSSC